jgi:energy-coupling factor transport system ATP-binding protein
MFHDTATTLTDQVALSDGMDVPALDIRNLVHRPAAILPGAASAIDGVSLTINRGEYVALMGPNGSGKTTLLRHINGLLLPTEGHVRAMGMATEDSACLPEIRRRVGLVFQDPDDQMVAVTVEDEIAFGLENLCWDGEAMRSRIGETLNRFGLDNVKDRATTSLSGGEQQLVAVAAVWAMDPDLLALDEPTSMLDRPSATRLLNMLDEIAGATNDQKQCTVLHVTQDIAEAARADRVIVMDRGRIVLDGPPKQILSDEDRLRDIGVMRRSTRTEQCSPNVSLSPVDESIPAMEVTNVHHVRTDDAVENRVLEGVSATVRAGSVLAVVGRSGSGKSTLAWHLNRLLEPSDGMIALMGDDIAQMPHIEVCRRVGMTFQRVDLQLFEMTVADDVAFGLVQQDISEAESRIRAAMAVEALGLSFEDYADRSPMSLSTGEKRRIALAGALVVDPDVLVLDEPTSGLDASGIDALVEQIRTLRDGGRTLIVVTHDLELAGEIADTVLHIEDGTGEASGAVDEVLAALLDEWSS